MISDRVRTVIISVVTAVWALNFVAGVVVKGYHPTESINGIFMAIVGGLFALGAKQASNSNGSKGSGDGDNDTKSLSGKEDE